MARLRAWGVRVAGARVAGARRPLPRGEVDAAPGVASSKPWRPGTVSPSPGKQSCGFPQQQVSLRSAPELGVLLDAWDRERLIPASPQALSCWLRLPIPIEAEPCDLVGESPA